MSALCIIPLSESSRFTRQFTSASLPMSKKIPGDPDANEPGSMPDEGLAIESPEFEDDDEDDTVFDPELDENLIDEDDVAPPNSPRGPR